jgi:oxalate decarboxylase/phosphoglucose isomerase-like protein (cupin superfamily)
LTAREFVQVDFIESKRRNGHVIAAEAGDVGLVPEKTGHVV